MRNRARELAFLTAAEAAALDPGRPRGRWTERALDRLDVRGPLIEPRPTGDYLRELAEEALDLGGWAALAVQAIPDPDLEPVLRRVAALGATAYALLVEAAAASRNRPQTLAELVGGEDAAVGAIVRAFDAVELEDVCQ